MKKTIFKQLNTLRKFDSDHQIKEYFTFYNTDPDYIQASTYQMNDNQMTEWASSNLDPSVVEAFDSLLDSGNAGAIQLAVNGLKAQYEEATGYEGRMLTGKAAQSSGDIFRSQPELVAAMNDPRYDNDPAYRQDLIEKLDRSDVQF